MYKAWDVSIISLVIKRGLLLSAVFVVLGGQNHAQADLCSLPENKILDAYTSHWRCDYAKNLNNLEKDYRAALANPRQQNELTDVLRHHILSGIIQYYGKDEDAVASRRSTLELILNEPTDLMKAINPLHRDGARRVKTALVGHYIPPEIDERFLENKNKLKWICRTNRTNINRAARDTVGSGIVSALFKMQAWVRGTAQAMQLDNLPVDQKLVTDTISQTALGLEPKMPFSFKSCGDLVDDLFKVMHPYCVSSGDMNECSAINMHLALSVAAFDERFDHAIVYIIEQLKPLAGLEYGNPEDGRRLQAKSIDTWALAREAVVASYGDDLSDSELTDYTMKLWVAFTNDDYEPYFATNLMNILKTNGATSRYEYLKPYLGEASTTNDSLQAFARTLRPMALGLNNKGVADARGIYYVTQTDASGLHHLVAGVYTAYEIKKLGHSDEAALWAAFVPGASYEVQDLLSHLREWDEVALETARKLLIKSGRVTEAEVKAGLDFEKLYAEALAAPADLTQGDLKVLKRASHLQNRDFNNFKVDSVNHYYGGRIGIEKFHAADRN